MIQPEAGRLRLLSKLGRSIGHQAGGSGRPAASNSQHRGRSPAGARPPGAEAGPAAAAPESPWVEDHERATAGRGFQPARRSVGLDLETKPAEMVAESEYRLDADAALDLKAHHVDEAQLAQLSGQDPTHRGVATCPTNTVEIGSVSSSTSARSASIPTLRAPALMSQRAHSCE